MWLPYNKADICSFFVDGWQADIICDAAKKALQLVRRSLEHAVACALDTQAVDSKLLLGRMSKLIRGRGMGLRCSGELLDISFCFFFCDASARAS